MTNEKPEEHEWFQYWAQLKEFLLSDIEQNVVQPAIKEIKASNEKNLIAPTLQLLQNQSKLSSHPDRKKFQKKKPNVVSKNDDEYEEYYESEADEELQLKPIRYIERPKKRRKILRQPPPRQIFHQPRPRSQYQPSSNRQRQSHYQRPVSLINGIKNPLDSIKNTGNFVTLESLLFLLLPLTLLSGALAGYVTGTSTGSSSSSTTPSGFSQNLTTVVNNYINVTTVSSPATGGGSPTTVNVNLDLTPVTDLLTTIIDLVLGLLGGIIGRSFDNFYFSQIAKFVTAPISYVLWSIQEWQKISNRLDPKTLKSQKEVEKEVCLRQAEDVKHYGFNWFLALTRYLMESWKSDLLNSHIIFAIQRGNNLTCDLTKIDEVPIDFLGY